MRIAIERFAIQGYWSWAYLLNYIQTESTLVDLWVCSWTGFRMRAVEIDVADLSPSIVAGIFKKQNVTEVNQFNWIYFVSNC